MTLPTTGPYQVLILKTQDVLSYSVVKIFPLELLTIGLEPITQREQILSLPCLPISPNELVKRFFRAGVD